ncbi:hypothetical protein RR46_00850 [Papilio xuthus]|uniref:Kazal-like domain-containing protein n=1 Tax=Papilio xuthus TaxID=66420 RepID=A0A0N1IB07_PAPXU|nr:hypothetical protein RR46_00850 [Papilio xuthus]
MRGAWAVAAAAVLALAACERRTDTDFEFEDAPVGAAASRDLPTSVYPAVSKASILLYPYVSAQALVGFHCPLCHELVCKKREVCLLRDAFTAQCASKKDVLRRGDTIVAARRERIDGEDDVFYEEEAAPESEAETPRPARRPDRPPARCVGCGSEAEAEAGEGAQFVCGSDNRTYSSLCRLDLHNCVRRAAVRLACRGFCPCREPPAPVAPAAPAARYRQVTAATYTTSFE